MPELWARAPDATNRKLRELFARDSGGANRKLKELWARDTAAVNRKIFSGGANWTYSVEPLYGTGWEVSYNASNYNEWKFKNTSTVWGDSGYWAAVNLNIAFSSPITLKTTKSGSDYGLCVGVGAFQNIDGTTFSPSKDKFFVQLYINGNTAGNGDWCQDTGYYSGGIFVTEIAISTLRIYISQFAVNKTSNYNFHFFLADGTNFNLNDRGSAN